MNLSNSFKHELLVKVVRLAFTEKYEALKVMHERVFRALADVQLAEDLAEADKFRTAFADVGVDHTKYVRTTDYFNTNSSDALCAVRLNAFTTRNQVPTILFVLDGTYTFTNGVHLIDKSYEFRSPVVRLANYDEDTGKDVFVSHEARHLYDAQDGFMNEVLNFAESVENLLRSVRTVKKLRTLTSVFDEYLPEHEKSTALVPTKDIVAIERMLKK